MDLHEKNLRFGTWALLCALLLRLSSNGFFDPLTDFLSKPDIVSFLLYLETGRIVRFSPSEDPLQVFSYESPPPVFPQEPAATVPVFTAADAASVDVKYGCSLRPDLESLIQSPTPLALKSDAPTVLILHTHTTESYTPTPDSTYEATAAFRTLDENYNMLALGRRLASLLEQGGITVLHDTQLHDYPSYNGSYNHARKSIQAYLKEYPSIQLVLDLHRDASGDNQNQMRPTVTIDGTRYAQLMLVVGTNAAGLTHPNWQQNLSLALKLHVQLQRNAPGIARHLNLRAQRFNQDESPGALLVEVGGAGNTLEEAIASLDILSKSILDLCS